jgi:hypothetical protein
MSAIVKGKIKGCTNGLTSQKVEFRARFVPDEQPNIEWFIPITAEQWHNMKFGQCELIVEIRV